MSFSPREIEVLDAISRSEAVGFNSLAHVFESRFAADELETIIDRFDLARIVDVVKTARTHVISLTREGRRVVEYLHRG